MPRHPFDPVSAAVGIVIVTFGVAVMAGEAVDVDTRDGDPPATAAVLVGVAILPWRRPWRATAEPHRQDTDRPDQPAAT